MIEDDEIAELIAMEIREGQPVKGNGSVDLCILSYARAKYGNNNPLENAYKEYTHAFEETENLKNLLIREAVSNVLGDLANRKVSDDLPGIKLYGDDRTYLDTVSYGVKDYIDGVRIINDSVMKKWY